MTTATIRAAADTILAIDLGKYKSVACLYHSTRPYDGRLWSPEETALVGALPDCEVARQTGRTRNAVTLKRRLLGRPGIRFQPGASRR